MLIKERLKNIARIVKISTNTRLLKVVKKLKRWRLKIVNIEICEKNINWKKKISQNAGEAMFYHHFDQMY